MLKTSTIEIKNATDKIAFDFAAEVKVHVNGSDSFRKGVVIGQKNSTKLFFLSLTSAKTAAELLNPKGKQSKK